MDLEFVFELLGVIAVFAVFGTAGVLFWRQGRSGSPSAGASGESLIDPTASQTLGQMAQKPDDRDESSSTGFDFGGSGDSGGGGGSGG